MRAAPPSTQLVDAPALSPVRRWVVDVRARRMIAAAAALGVMFVVLAVLFKESGGTALDVAVTKAVQRIDNPAFSWLMLAISAPGYWPWGLVVLCAASLGLVLARCYPEALFLLATEGAGLLTAQIKLMIERPRPSGDSIRVVSAALDYSFPSGHVVGYVALYGFLFFLTYVLLRRSWLRSLLLGCLGSLVALIGVSRIHLGHHWVSDVLGGYALGTAYLLLLIVGYRLLVARPMAEAAPFAAGGPTDGGTKSAFSASHTAPLDRSR
jgi:membrane-associated phospholipid phosphatase